MPEPYNNLAVLYAGQGQYDKAKIALEMAIRTHPSYATAHENLGDIYAKMASQAYDRALQLDKSNASTQTKLALIKDLFTGGKSAKASPTPRKAAASAAKAKAAAPAAAATPDKVAAVVPVPTPVPAPVSVPVAVASTVAETPSAAPASAVSVAATTPEPADIRRNDVLKALQDWADAWSSKNVAAYLSFYASDFKTPNGESRATWDSARTERISKPKSIKVGISNAKVSFTDDNHATVSFRQSYRASHLSTSSKKILALVKTEGKWLIQEERSGK